MTLLEFFQQPNAPKQVVFAEGIGVKQAAFNHYIHGRRAVPGEIARLIVEATKGMVHYDDLFPYKAAITATSN